MGRGSESARRRIPGRLAVGGLAAGLFAALAGAAAIAVLLFDAEPPDYAPAVVSLPLASGPPADGGVKEPEAGVPADPTPASPQEDTESQKFVEMARTPPVPTPREPEFEEVLPSVSPPLPLDPVPSPDPVLDETMAVVSILPEPARQPEPGGTATSPSAVAPAKPAAARPVPTMPSSIFGSNLPSLMELASAGGGAVPRLARRDVIGWNNIRWGVTVEVLKRRFDGILSKYDEANFEAFRADHYLKGVRYFSLGFDIIFQMSKSDGRLAQVLIDHVDEPHRGDFETIYATMRRIYGEPSSRENFLTDSDAYFGIDPTANAYKKATWRFPTTTIQLTVLTGPDFFRATKGWLYLRYYPSRPGRS